MQFSCYAVRLGAAATAFLHKLQKGIPPWTPLKGFEKKTYKQLQEEALESKRRDMAVLEANGGIWPGVRTPSHALFLWASGSQLTTMLERDHMPNKYIPKELRLHHHCLSLSFSNFVHAHLLVKYYCLAFEFVQMVCFFKLFLTLSIISGTPV